MKGWPLVHTEVLSYDLWPHSGVLRQPVSFPGVEKNWREEKVKKKDYIHPKTLPLPPAYCLQCCDYEYKSVCGNCSGIDAYGAQTLREEGWRLRPCLHSLALSLNTRMLLVARGRIEAKTFATLVLKVYSTVTQHSNTHNKQTHTQT